MDVGLRKWLDQTEINFYNSCYIWLDYNQDLLFSISAKKTNKTIDHSRFQYIYWFDRHLLFCVERIFLRNSSFRFVSRFARYTWMGGGALSNCNDSFKKGTKLLRLMLQNVRSWTARVEGNFQRLLKWSSSHVNEIKPMANGMKRKRTDNRASKLFNDLSLLTKCYLLIVCGREEIIGPYPWELSYNSKSGAATSL